MTKAEIITIGTEIISGQIVDTNTPYIAQNLSEKGIQVQFQTSVGDDKELLTSALKIARDRANLIITTGGLGPTANDITREAVSEFFDIPLIQDKDAFVRIQKYFGGQHRNVPDAPKNQTLIPEGALALHNDNGTATGFALNRGNTEIVCLPGVPRAMQSMLHKYLEIYTKKHTLEGRCTLLRDLHTFGISEPDVEVQIKAYTEREEQIKAMTLVHNGIVTINIIASSTDRENTKNILDKA